MHRNTVAARKEPIITINEKVYLGFLRMVFSTSYGCLKPGAFIFSGQVSVDITPPPTHSESRLSNRCLVVPVCPHLPYSLCCGGHPHGTRDIAASVKPVCCHHVNPLFLISDRFHHIKPKLTEKEKKVVPFSLFLL